jgi:hypothetical protein
VFRVCSRSQRKMRRETDGRTGRLGLLGTAMGCVLSLACGHSASTATGHVGGGGAAGEQVHEAGAGGEPSDEIGCVESDPVSIDFAEDTAWGFSADSLLTPWLGSLQCELTVASFPDPEVMRVTGVAEGSYSGLVSLQCDTTSTVLVTVEKRGDDPRLDRLYCIPGYVLVNCRMQFQFPSGAPNGSVDVVARLTRDSSDLELVDDGEPRPLELYSLQYGEGYSALGTSLGCALPDPDESLVCDVLETGIEGTPSVDDAGVTTASGPMLRILAWTCT